MVRRDPSAGQVHVASSYTTSSGSNFSGGEFFALLSNSASKFFKSSLAVSP